MRGTKARQNKYRIIALAVSLLLMAQAFLLPTTVVYADENTFAAGSLIIPMDATYQNTGMWKAYGLVYDLLSKGVYVSWAISDTKTYNGIDFTATTKDLRTNAAVGSFSYRGGPFIISSEDAARAKPLIQAWWAKYPGLPVVHEATASYVANVDIILKHAPRIANEETNAGISMNYYNTAGIPDGDGNVWSTDSPGVLDETEIANGGLFLEGRCSPRAYDIFVTPHNDGYAYSLTDPTNLGTRTYSELDFFTHQGGGWIACCHSIISNETIIADLYHNGSAAVKATLNAPVPGGMLTYNAIPNQDNVGGTWYVKEPNLPLAQVVPTTVLQALPGGAMQTWNSTTAGYYPETERVAGFLGTDGIEYDLAVNGVGHNGSTQGKITFIGGHSYSTSVPYTNNFEGPYLRFFYNALYYNSVGVPKMDLIVTPDHIPQGKPTTVMLELKNSGASPATNTNDVEIYLPEGLTYEGMHAGPAPISITGDPSIGITLSWGNSLGDIDDGASVFTVKVGAAPDSTGEIKFCNYKATYGDVFGERFRAEQCRTIIVYSSPEPSISKEPATQSVISGGVVTWTLNYSNTGPEPLYNTVIEDILPAGVGFKSAVPVESPTPVVLPDGTTRIHWDTGTLAVGESRTIILNAYTPFSTVPTSFTNNVTLTGNDWNGYVYHAADSAEVDVSPPPVQLEKAVSPAGAVDITAAGEVLTYTLRPAFHGDGLLENVMISDAIPHYTSYVGGSINAGGSYGFTPLPKVDGVDSSTFSGTTTVSITAAPTVVALNGTVTATMTITNNSGTTISNIIPQLLEQLGPTGANISAPSASGFTLINGASQTVTFTCEMLGLGERLLGTATGIRSDAGGGSYTFANALSNSILVLSRLNASPAGDVVTWRLGSNTPAADGLTTIGGSTDGIYAFPGNGAGYLRHDIPGNNWAAKANAPAAVLGGGALAYDGGGYTDGYIYALRGNAGNGFWRYDISADTWLAMANIPANVSNGGALVYLDGYIYALRGGGTTGFYRYDPAANTWSSMASTLNNVNAGGALITDGAYLYAFRGDGQKTFWRYNPALNTWLARADTPANVKNGGAMTYLNGYIYAFGGDNKTNFWRYDSSANTWSAMTTAPANVGPGGALVTDGIYIYGLRGNTTNNYWRYDAAANAWAAMQPVSQNVAWGGALAYLPGESAQYNVTHFDVNHSMTTTGDEVAVTMNISSTSPVTGVLPSTPVITGTGGASATIVSGPTLISADNSIADINDPVIYRWTYTVSSGANPGSVTFSAGATGSPGITFPTAVSQSIIVSPVLEFRVRINGTASLPAEASRIINTGMFSDTGLIGYGVESNSVITPLNRSSLTIAKTNTPDDSEMLKPGDEITYTVVLKNEGTGIAEKIEVSDIVPPYTSFVPGSVTVLDTPQDPGRSLQVFEPSGGNPLRVKIDYLNLDESVTVVFRVVINQPPTEGTYQTANFATVSATGVPAFNSNTVINNFEYYFNPSFDVSKNADPVTAYAVGETINYTVVLINTGGVPLSSVTVNDPLITNMAYAYGDDNSDNILDLYEQWTYTGTYVIQQTDVDENGEGLIVNIVTADTAETDAKTAQADVVIKLAKSHLVLTKTVDYLPGGGYGPIDANTLFTIHLRETTGKYTTDLLMKANETIELDVPSGIYEITEPAVPFEYRKTGTQAFIYAFGAPGAPFAVGIDNLVNVQAFRVNVEVLNTFKHITYFHALDNIINRFSSP